MDLGLACLLVGVEVDPGLDVADGVADLDRLAATVPAGEPHPAGAQHAAGAPEPAVAAADRLRTVLGGFGGAAQDYADLRSSLLHEVLRRRRGLPILLSTVWTEVAQRAGIPSYGVALPGHFVAGIGDPAGDHVLVDPWRGGVPLSHQDVVGILAGTTGLPLTADQLGPADPVDVLLRVLTNVRALATRTGSIEVLRTRLWATELSLLLPRHPLALRRERGDLRVRLGDFLGGAAELESYAETVAQADPDAAAQATTTARLARARCN